MRWIALSLTLAACSGTPAGGDGGADSGMDGGRVDGGVDAGTDAGRGDDAGAIDAGTPCSVGGVPGTCMHVDDCTGTSTAGFCPGPAEIQCCTASTGTCDPTLMPTPNDGIVDEAGDLGCPRGMARIEAFCVDRYEAHLVVVDDTGPVASWSPYHNPGSARVMAVSAAGAIPQGYIDQRRASDACAEAGKRLCTDVEWLRACRGPFDYVYPYGDVRMDEVCNDWRDGGHPAVERFGTSADWIWSELGDACINQIPDSLMPCGAHTGCVTSEGAFDMMGNLHEWTADPAGTFRGGFYYDTSRNGDGCLYATTAHDVSHWDYSTGFRCCADAI